MKSMTRIPFRLTPRLVNAPVFVRPLSSTVAKAANVAPVVGTGPPPQPPIPSTENAHERVARRRKQAEMLKNAKEIRSAGSAKSNAGGMKKRFWKDVSIQEVDGK